VSRVAVFGATGFVGATLVERLLQNDRYEVVPIIRSPGNAWRLSRHGLELQSVDIVSGKGLDKSLAGVDCVVNCTRGSKEVMLDGLANLLRSASKHGVERFIHLSSVMIYGDPPVAATEDVLPAKQSLDTYGGLKFRQDEMVVAAARRGLSSCILVPPNISGPYSFYLLGILNALNAGQFALMDGGNAPVNLVDVENLCQAIELSLTNGGDAGERYFVTDDEKTSWAELVKDLQELQMTQVPSPAVSRAELEQIIWQLPKPKKASFLRSMKHLVSSDIREALRKDPFWEKVDHAIRGLIGKLGSRAEEKLRLSVEGPVAVNRRTTGPNIDVRLSGQQLREGRHSIEKARRELGYSPAVSYAKSMDNFKTWYRRLHGLDGEFEKLLRELYV